LMLALRWNRLSGSYRRLTSASRATWRRPTGSHAPWP
jgi:hypothetical protein